MIGSTEKKGVLRYFFEYGAGGCLWTGDNETSEKLGYGPVDAGIYDLNGNLKRLPALPLSDKAQELRNELDELHQTYLNHFYQPDPSLWRQSKCDRFNHSVDKLLGMIKAELGEDFEILDQQDRYTEDPKLDSYLLAHSWLEAQS